MYDVSKQTFCAAVYSNLLKEIKIKLSPSLGGLFPEAS